MSKTPEQEARNILERMEIKGAQNFSAGELAEIANIIAEIARLRAALQRISLNVSGDMPAQTIAGAALTPND